jgi:phosphoribosyl 1,2-cyclic phosphodiesterase
MSLQFCVLGSGSQGNATLLSAAGLAVLIDAGFLPDDMAARLAQAGQSWESLDAVVLTHTHGDHIKKKCLKQCAQHGIRFVCHEHHVEQLSGSRYFKQLAARGLIETYDGTHEFALKPGEKSLCAATPLLHAQAGTAADGVATENQSAAGAHGQNLPLPTRPVARHVPRHVPGAVTGDAAEVDTAADAFVFHPILVPHDCPPTFGFRIEALLGERTVNIGYLSDLGECDEHIVEQMFGVDLLALEFNHDVPMQVGSGRHPRLIERVLGRDGHLSNAQAADVFRSVIERGQSAPQVLVQLHLSEDCNRPDLAYRAAQEVLFLSGAQTKVFSSRQDRCGTVHTL